MSPSLTPFHALYLVFVPVTFGDYKSVAIEFTIVPLELLVQFHCVLVYPVKQHRRLGTICLSGLTGADFTWIKNG